MNRVWTFLMACLLLFTLKGYENQIAVGQNTLTSEEIARINQAFVSTKEVLVNGQPIVQATPISCFFTSQYADVTQIDLEEFLRYCPIGSVLTDDDAQEFQAVMQQINPGFDDETALPSGYPVPVHRFKREDVSALLKKYANITVEDLQNTEGVIYSKSTTHSTILPAILARAPSTARAGKRWQTVYACGQACAKAVLHADCP